ncbi:MAG TPA: DinB family protein [Holophagaceae bacterium]|nr:DinB family protein [Holophagaceae bacterium]
MYRRLDDFRAQFQEEVDDTLKVLRAIPETAAAQAVSPAHRDLRRLAWHLVESLVSLPGQIGLVVDGPAVDAQGTALEPIPDSMAEITRRYERAAASLLAGLATWSDSDLLVEDTMYGHMVWARGYSLRALEMHQAHHRGQITVVMRQAGLKPPAFYGPALEDWAALGAPAPAV